MVTHEDFTLRLPEGFERLSDNAVTMAEAQIGDRELMILRDDPPLAIIIDRVEGDGDPSNLEECVSIATEYAKDDAASPPRPVPFELPDQKTCRWEYQVRGEVVISTILRGRHRHWLVHCNFKLATGEDAGRAGCDEVVRGFGPR